MAALATKWRSPGATLPSPNGKWFTSEKHVSCRTSIAHGLTVLRVEDISG